MRTLEDVHPEGSGEHIGCSDVYCCPCECATCRTMFRVMHPPPSGCPMHAKQQSLLCPSCAMSVRVPAAWQHCQVRRCGGPQGSWHTVRVNSNKDPNDGVDMYLVAADGLCWKSVPAIPNDEAAAFSIIRALLCEEATARKELLLSALRSLSVDTSSIQQLSKKVK